MEITRSVKLYRLPTRNSIKVQQQHLHRRAVAILLLATDDGNIKLQLTIQRLRRINIALTRHSISTAERRLQLRETCNGEEEKEIINSSLHIY